MWRSSCVVGLLVVAGCGSHPPVPQGKWACKADNGQLTIDVDYAADGSKTGTAHMTRGDGSLDFNAQMKFVGIWELKADQLTESMTVEVVSATANGAPMADGVQAMLRDVLGAKQTSTVKVTGADAMALINDAYGLACTRA